MKNVTVYTAFAWILLVLGGIISLVFLILTYLSDINIEKNFDFERTGQFGDYIGGVVGTIFALAGTVLVYASFVGQQRRNTRESFELTYFEMLKVHEEIVKELRYRGKESRDIFPDVIDYLRSLYNQVFSHLNDIKQKAQSHKIHDPHVADEVLYKFLDSIDLPYMATVLSVGYLYYGSDKYYLTSKSEEPLRVINEKVKENINSDAILPLDNVLGHYYRQMFHIVKYVANTEWLKEEQKYEYIKMLRAQLSDYEQMMLFYNSISVNGNKWRLPDDEANIPQMGYISRFRLIKNIPFHYDYFGNHPNNYFEAAIKAWKEKGKPFFENEMYTI